MKVEICSFESAVGSKVDVFLPVQLRAVRGSKYEEKYIIKKPKSKRKEERVKGKGTL